jgi:hypothetical protein
MEKFKKIINPTLDFCLYLLVGFVPIFYSPLFLNERELLQQTGKYDIQCKSCCALTKKAMACTGWEPI